MRWDLATAEAQWDALLKRLTLRDKVEIAGFAPLAILGPNELAMAGSVSYNPSGVENATSSRLLNRLEHLWSQSLGRPIRIVIEAAPPSTSSADALARSDPHAHDSVLRELVDMFEARALVIEPIGNGENAHDAEHEHENESDDDNDHHAVAPDPSLLEVDGDEDD